MKRFVFSLFILVAVVSSAYAKVYEAHRVFASNATNATLPVNAGMTWTEITALPCDSTNSTTTAIGGTASVWVRTDGAMANGTQKWIDLTGTIDFTNPSVEIIQGSYTSIIVNATALNTPNFVVFIRQWQDGE